MFSPPTDRDLLRLSDAQLATAAQTTQDVCAFETLNIYIYLSTLYNFTSLNRESLHPHPHTHFLFTPLFLVWFDTRQRAREIQSDIAQRIAPCALSAAQMLSELRASLQVLSTGLKRRMKKKVSKFVMVCVTFHWKAFGALDMKNQLLLTFPRFPLLPPHVSTAGCSW